MVQKKNIPVSELSVKDLAERHLDDAIAQLGALTKSADPQVALEASQTIIGMARPSYMRGGGFSGGWSPSGPDDGPGGWRGGFGGRPGGFGGWPGGFGGWPSDFGGFGGWRAG